MRRGPVLRSRPVAHQHSLNDTRPLPPGRVTPFGGRRSTPNGAETEAVTAYSVARLAPHEAEADSLWARRLSVVGLAAATATLCRARRPVAHRFRRRRSVLGLHQLGLRRRRPARRRHVSAAGAARRRGAAWVWIAAGIFAWTFGDIYYTVALQDLASQPFPSFADLGYLGFYVPVFVGLGLLVRVVRRRFPRLRLGRRSDRRVHRLRARDGSRARPRVAHVDRQLRRRSRPTSPTRPETRCCSRWSSARSGCPAGS